MLESQSLFKWMSMKDEFVGGMRVHRVQEIRQMFCLGKAEHREKGAMRIFMALVVKKKLAIKEHLFVIVKWMWLLSKQ